LETLTFSTFSEGLAAGPPAWILDDIQFSSSPVPEPRAAYFVGLGLIAFGLLHWQKWRQLTRTGGNDIG